MNSIKPLSIILCFLVLLVFKVSLVYTNEHRLKIDDYENSLVQFYSGVNSADPDVRAVCINKHLNKLQGVEADTLRALAWIKEDREDLRNTLLEQLVANCYLEKRKVEKALLNMTMVFPEEVRRTRIRKIDILFNKPNIVDKLKKDVITLTNRSEGINYDAIVNLEVLGENKEIRKKAYNDIKAAWGRSATEFRLMLWAAEPDPDLQKFLLIQAREESEDVRYGFYIKFLIPIIGFLPEDQQHQRIKMIEELWNTKVEDQK